MEQVKEEIEKLRALKDVYKEKSDAKTEAFHELETAELRVKTILEELDTIEYEKVKKEHKVQLKVDQRARVPKTDEDKAAFFQWLKDMEYYDAYITVNSQSINSLVKKEFELNKDTPDYQIPGLEIIEEVKLKY